MSLHRTVALAIVTVTAGCRPYDGGYSTLVSNANRAHQSGDLTNAALFYRQACTVRPKSESCEKATALTAAAVTQSTQAAQIALSSYQFDKWKEALKPATLLARNDPAVIASNQLAIQMLRAHCQVDDLADAKVVTNRVRCFSWAVHNIGGISAYSAYREVATKAAATMDQKVESAARSGLFGAALVYQTAASCFAPKTARPANAQSLAKRMLAESELRIRIDSKTATPLTPAALASESLCASVQKRVEGVQCSESPEFEFVVSSQLEATKHTLTRDTQSGTYQKSTQVTPNPAYPALVDSASKIEQRTLRIELELRKQERACDDAKRVERPANCNRCAEKIAEERLCEAAESMRQIYRDQQRDLDDARDLVRKTPQRFETAVMDTFSFPVSVHHWTTPYRTTVHLRGDRIDFGDSGELWFKDEEHGGFSPGGIERDRFQPPSPNFFEQTLSDRIALKIAAIVKVELTKRASARGQSCPEVEPQWSDEWLECWAETKLWGDENFEPQKLVKDQLCILN